MSEAPRLEWRRVPAGPFTMGSDPASEHAPDPDEAPRHGVDVEAFLLGRTPVTNAQYRVFVETSGHRPPASWPGGVSPPGRELHPVTYVTWDEAAAFCAWAGGFLPSEAQWERAARGDDERTWPWGDEPPTPAHAVLGETDTRAVGGRLTGAGPFGHLDLAGNAWEWTASPYLPYPLGDAPGVDAHAARVVRGGSFIHSPSEARCSARHGMLPGTVDHYVGFRLAAAPGAAVEGIELLDVPAGHVIVGNDPRAARGPAPPDEAPLHRVAVDAFELAVTPVTNAQYAAFVHVTGRPAPIHWDDGTVPPGLERHPVTYVDWHDAMAFCEWAGARLPSEAEWEKAARSEDGRRYPWGEAPPDETRAHALQGLKRGSTAAVGAAPAGASPYGLHDMAGNVWEWVSTAYRPYPYAAADGREEPASDESRVLRGGSYASLTASHLRCARRSASRPGRRSPHIGFRLARGLGEGIPRLPRLE